MSKVVAKIGILFLYLLSFLPFRALYILSDGIYFLLYHVIAYRKKVVYLNLIRSFPEKSEEEIKKIIKGFYRNLSDIIVEIIKSFSISEKSLRKRFNIINIDIPNRLYEEGRSIISVNGHYTNWEFLTQICPLVMKHPSLGIYKPLKNQAFDRLFYRSRSRFGLQPIAMSQILRELVKKRNTVWGLGIVADQTPSNTDANYWTTFLNQATCVFSGIEKMCIQFNTPLLFFDVRRVKRGYYEIEFVLLKEDVQNTKEYELTELHLRYLENKIKKNPADWLWSHKRWKHQPSEEMKKKFNL